MAYIDTPETQKSNRTFMRNAMNAPLLEADHEQELALKWRDDKDEAALHELIESYMRLVISMANRFRNYGLPIGDLVQEGNVGLMQAAARFDPDRQVRFSTYTSWWIRSAMQDYVLRNWSIVRTGTTTAQKSLFFNLRRLRAQINDNSSTTLTLEGRDFVAKELGVSMRDVQQMDARLSASDRSLNAPYVEQGEGQWQDLLPDERPMPEEAVMEARDRKTIRGWIDQALAHLTDRERTIISERRLTDEVVTLEALGRRLGISKERVRQIESQALGKIKGVLVDIAGDPVEAGLASS